MARLKTTTTPPAEETEKSLKRPSKADRSSYFARREAAKVLKTVLQGDARRRALASIKTLIYSPTVRNKKATFALVCQTLKHLPIIKDIIEGANVLNTKWKSQKELIYIIAYDILFGQAAVVLSGDAEKFLMQRKDALQSALAELCVRKNVERKEDLYLLYNPKPDTAKPRYVRVNTLKLDLKSAFHELSKQYKVQRDDVVPDLLVLPIGTDLHDHPLVKNGSIFLQSKASSMVAVALGAEPGWEVVDACSAPGNKTVHLAALMRGKGKITACELNKDRVRRLEDTIKCSGATNVEVLHGDFLKISKEDPSYSKVRAILLDPSCTGSGTAAQRLDHLLPSYNSGQTDDVADTTRVKKLAAFQSKALAHALSFPAVERVVYSTCSIHQTENEDVVKSVLPLATSLGFHLETPFPNWPRRGHPVVEGSEHLLRTDPVMDMEGFFIALFVRKSIVNTPKPDSRESKDCSSELKMPRHQNECLRKKITKKKILPTRFGRIAEIMLHAMIRRWKHQDRGSI